MKSIIYYDPNHKENGRILKSQKLIDVGREITVMKIQ